MKLCIYFLLTGMAWGQTLEMDCSKGWPECPQGHTCTCKKESPLPKPPKAQLIPCTPENYCTVISPAPKGGAKPEVVDVPAIKRVVVTGWMLVGSPSGSEARTFNCNEGHWWLMNDYAECRVTRWSCADKSRILLTAEDGSKHCIKFR